MPLTPIAEALTELKKIFTLYERTQYGDRVNELLNWEVTDASRLEAELAKDELWSGPQAIWIATLYEGPGRPIEMVREHEQRYRNAVIRLVEAMDAAGIYNPNAAKVSARLQTMNKLATSQAHASGRF